MGTYEKARKVRAEAISLSATVRAEGRLEDSATLDDVCVCSDETLAALFDALSHKEG